MLETNYSNQQQKKKKKKMQSTVLQGNQVAILYLTPLSWASMHQKTAPSTAGLIANAQRFLDAPFDISCGEITDTWTYNSGVLKTCQSI